MWHKHKVSVVLVTKNNGSSIRDVVESLFYTGFIDEVLAIDIGSRDETLSELSYTKARVLNAESFQDAFIIGMDRTRGNLIIFADSNNLIPASEVKNFLPYSDSYHIVFSSRTSWLGYNIAKTDKKYFDQNVKLGFEFSKHFESVLYTDINSSMFMIRKDTSEFRKFKFEMNKEFFIFELMLNALRLGLCNIQIPVEFHSDLKTVDEFLLGSRKNVRIMNKLIKSNEKKLSHKSLTSSKKSKVTSHTVGVQLEASNDDEKLDPEWVKKRIRDLRAKLGASEEKPFVSKNIKSELDDAVASIMAGSKDPVIEEKKLSIEDQYKILKDLDAGLVVHKRKHRSKNK